MSRIGKLPVAIPAGVTVTVSADHIVSVKGPKGEDSCYVDPVITIEIKDNVITFTRNSEDKAIRAKHGLYRALVANMVKGVVTPYEKGLIVNGVGYKVVKQGKKVVFNVGYSHPVEFEEPAGITIDVVSPTEVAVKGINKDAVGQCAANIRKIRLPEPYHGYGIRYKDEHIQMKEGKQGK